MAKTSPNSPRAQADRALKFLAGRYPDPRPHLRARSPWELLAATILSAQCTDARVNSVTPELFARLPGPAETAGAQPAELEKIIKSTGFFRMKARSLIGAAKRIMEAYDGRVPSVLAELITLPGVARKTANVVLWGAFGVNEGLAVDTHVKRIAFRLGLSAESDPDKVERDLLPLFPRSAWGDVNHRMVSFGREICRARAPLCAQCGLAPHCPRRGVDKSSEIR